jgi:hypothetical protein
VGILVVLKGNGTETLVLAEIYDFGSVLTGQN